MSQVIINNDDTGLVVRNALNGMLAELYGSIVSAIKIKNQAVSFQYPVPANTKVYSFDLVSTAGAPIVRVGTTPNGTEISGDPLAIDDDSQPLVWGKYCAGITQVYFTIEAGTISIRITMTQNFF